MPIYISPLNKRKIEALQLELATYAQYLIDELKANQAVSETTPELYDSLADVHNLLKVGERKNGLRDYRGDLKDAVQYVYTTTPYSKPIRAKLEAIWELKSILETPDTCANTILTTFQTELRNSTATMSQNRSQSSFRDASWKRMLTNLFAILTVVPGLALSIHSRFFSNKKTFNFTATTGEAVVDRMENIVALKK